MKLPYLSNTLLWSCCFWVVCSASLISCDQINPRGEVDKGAVVAQSATPEKAASASLQDIPPDMALRYFSGNVKNFHNHPCVYWESTLKALIVVGRGHLDTFHLDRIDSAIAVYDQMVNHYELGVPVNYQGKEMVMVQWDDLMPSDTEAKQLFSSKALSTLKETASGKGFEMFSGHDGQHFDIPLIYNGSKVLTLLTQDTLLQFETHQIDSAINALVQLSSASK